MVSDKETLSDEDILRRLILELQALQGTARTLQTRIGLIGAAVAELQASNATLEGLKKEERGKTILVPIGGGSYVKATLADSKRVVFGIGANVASEKTFDESQISIGERVAELEKTRTALQQQLNQVAEKIDDTQDKIQAMAQPDRR